MKLALLFSAIKNYKGVVQLALSVKELLENKGIKSRDEHLEILEQRWKGMKELRSDLKGANIDDADISLRNIPGGDHVE